jgi:hypothetical protein
MQRLVGQQRHERPRQPHGIEPDVDPPELPPLGHDGRDQESDDDERDGDGGGALDGVECGSDVSWRAGPVPAMSAAGG